MRARADLKSKLAPEFRASKNWADLDRRLGLKGYSITLIAQELLLQDAEQITICSLAALGHSDMHLIRRFGPRQPHATGPRFART